MGSWNGLFGVVGVIYLWPLTLIAIVALWACIALTEAEYEDGVMTNSGKQLVRSRAFLGIGCAIDCVCILPGLFSSSIFSFWTNWRVLLVLMSAADISLLVAMFFGFRARGSRIWIVRGATMLIAIASTAAMLMMLSKM